MRSLRPILLATTLAALSGCRISGICVDNRCDQDEANPAPIAGTPYGVKSGTTQNVSVGSCTSPNLRGKWSADLGGKTDQFEFLEACQFKNDFCEMSGSYQFVMDGTTAVLRFTTKNSKADVRADCLPILENQVTNCSYRLVQDPSVNNGATLQLRCGPLDRQYQKVAP